MKQKLNRWIVLGAVALGMGAVTSHPAPAAMQEEMATVEQLTSEAFEALRIGRFERTNELLGRAASIAEDPQLSQMADWIGQFESQRQEFLAERRRHYEKEIEHIETLLAHDKDDFVPEYAAKAYALAEDKEAFHREPWVRDLIASTIRMAERYETEEEWLKALRLYSNLGSIQPNEQRWKDKLSVIARRVRLLALYTPDELKTLRETETAERRAVEKLLDPENEKDEVDPQADALEEIDEGFRIDWRDTLRGIRMNVLWDGRGQGALRDARNNYYRDVTYRDMLIGGLEGLRTLATTSGLEEAFPRLANEENRRVFLAAIDDGIEKIGQATLLSEHRLVGEIMSSLQEANRRSVQLPEEVLASEFADGAFAALDEFTGMIWPSDLEEFNRTTQGQFSGVGIQIQLTDDGSLKVVSPLEDSPARRAGIQAGDIITHIDGKNARGITLNQAVRHITGEEGTKVTLTVRSPDGSTADRELRRETIKVESIKGWQYRPGGGWDYLIDPEQKIAYVRLTNFTKNTARDLDLAVEEMKKDGAKGMILDLRNNPGGLLTSATEITDRFIRDGAIVSTQADRTGSNQRTVLSASATGEEIDLPTVILVNQYSASASEIVAGALRDHEVARVVGERTFGKGSVQMIFPMSNRQAALKLTTSHYYLPGGRNIHRKDTSTEWGVDPDVVIEMTPQQMRAAISARQEMDIIRDLHAQPGEDEQPRLEDKAEEVEQAVADAEAKADPLSADPQLSAALLMMRLQLAGAEL